MDKLKGALLVGALRLFALLPWGAVQAVGGDLAFAVCRIAGGQGFHRIHGRAGHRASTARAEIRAAREPAQY